MAHVEILLTNGHTTLVDCADVPKVLDYSWHRSDTGYAVWRGVKDGKKQTIRMHRLIADTPDDLVTDHKNHDRLDNRRANLRVCTQQQNLRNTKGEKGYVWDASKGKWLVRYRKQFYGRYTTEDEARKAYQLAKSGVPYQKRERRQMYHLPTGVFRSKSNKSYQAQIQIDGKYHYLGSFPTVEEAEKAYLNMKGNK